MAIFEPFKNHRKQTFAKLFDEEWYLANFPETKQSQLSPRDHYLRFGYSNRNDPNPLFHSKDLNCCEFSS
jgi:hypothetical protein